jgi:hypothetical protein
VANEASLLSPTCAVSVSQIVSNAHVVCTTPTRATSPPPPMRRCRCRPLAGPVAWSRSFVRAHQQLARVRGYVHVHEQQLASTSLPCLAQKYRRGMDGSIMDGWMDQRPAGRS